MFASPLGLLIGLSLGALGGGGSILAVPVLVHAAGQSPQEATATSLVVVGLAAVLGLFDHHRGGRVEWPIGATFVATGIFGAMAGTTLNQRLDGDVLLVGFAVLMLVVAGRMLVKARSSHRADRAGASADGDSPTLCGEPGSCAVALSATLRRSSGGDVRAPLDLLEALGPRSPGVVDGPDDGRSFVEGGTWRSHRLWRSRRCLARLVVAGTVVGFLTGLFGVGGGFIIVPALTLGLGMTMPAAVGTSLLIIAGNAAMALGLRGVGSVDWSVAAPFAIAAGIGVLLGSRLAGRLPAAKASAAFAVLTIAIALYTGVQAVGGLT